MGVYKHPRALYTKLTHSLIYFVATVKLEEKHENKNRHGKSNVAKIKSNARYKSCKNKWRKINETNKGSETLA